MIDGSASTKAGARSGPRVTRAFQRLLSVIFLIAWASLGSQIQLLIGSRGLLPIAPLREQLLAHGIGFSRFPSLLLYDASDGTLTALVIAGLGLSVCSLFGLWSSLAFGFNTLLYLSCTVAGQTFLSFQWDNLLLECGLLAMFLRSDREQRWLHFLFRMLLFKLYCESGIAKYQSYLGDWQAGSAMAHYYETAPIPTALAWFMHQLPAGWHKLESWLTLTWEILVPFLIFGPRATRLLALGVFTLFQLINLSTANYGFFCHLALILNVFLLNDADLDRWARAIRRRAARWRRRWSERGYAVRRWAARYRLLARSRRRWSRAGSLAVSSGLDRKLSIGRRIGAVLAGSIYLGVSLDDGLSAFWPEHAASGAWVDAARALYGPLRLINCYHLFGHITPERIEPEIQVFDGNDFHPLAFHYKPGPVTRAPPFVAPHQPRVDFQLWFYGLSYHQGTPAYVVNLLKRVCHDPAAVQALFTSPLPKSPQAVRLVFYQYTFTSPEERNATGAWWHREQIDAPKTMPCGGR